MATKLEQNRKKAEEAGYIAAAYEAEQANGIPTGMLVGLLEQESAWRPDVISGRKKSRAGALGIAQFMPATAADEGVDPLKPREAIAAAGKYLAKMRKSAGSWTGALTSYNWGIGNYRDWVNGERKDQPKEAREYARKVQERARKYGGVTEARPTDAEAIAQPVEPVIADTPVAPLPDAYQSAPTSTYQIPDTPIVEPIPAMDTPAVPTPDTPAGPVIAPPTSPAAAPTPLGSVPSTSPTAITPRTNPTELPLSEFKMRKPKDIDVTIATPRGPAQVKGETPEEEQIIRELAGSGETQLLSLMPELLQTRDSLKSKPLIATRGDATDKLLLSIIDGV